MRERNKSSPPYFPFIPNIPHTNEMLAEAGFKSMEELFQDIPSEIRFKGKMNLPEPHTEYETWRHLKNILSKNKELLIFAGGGFYPHYIPYAVEELSSRTEFYSSYTPYTAEASQGMLQSLFEYQSLICEITGMDVANSSMYDWNTALGEAARMAYRINKRREITIPKIIPRDRLKTLQLYTEALGLKIRTINFNKNTGTVDVEDLENKISKATSAFYFEFPYDIGTIEIKTQEISEIVHEAGALLIVGVNPFALGIFKPPGEYNADIVIGEGQALGNPLSFGGGALGIFACKGEKRIIYQMPGRIIGLTTTLDGSQRGYVMTLPNREQHIRRERATSNICTNEALVALRTAIYLSLIGKKGFEEISRNILAKTSYVVSALKNSEHLKIPFKNAIYFSDFVLKFISTRAKEVWLELLKRDILAGRISEYTDLEALTNSLILAVTEIHTKEDLDLLINNIFDVLESQKGE